MKTPLDAFEAAASRILGEPATGSRGQGGLPVTGTVIDWEMRFTKAGKEHLVSALRAEAEKLVEAELLGELQTLEDIVTQLEPMNKTMMALHGRIAALRARVARSATKGGSQ